MFRVIPTQIRSFQELGLPEVMQTLALRENGLVLVTGPTGSGKSTTLAAMIDLVNATREEAHHHARGPDRVRPPAKGCLVNQREIGSHTKSFAAALRARPPRGPRRHPGRRDARPRDDQPRARPPRRPATSSSARFTPRARRRRSTASSTRSRPRSSSRCACSWPRPSRASSRSSCSRRRTRRAGSPPSRSWWRRSPSGTSSGKGRPTRCPRRSRRAPSSACRVLSRPSGIS